MAPAITRRFSNGTSYGNSEAGDAVPDLWHLYSGGAEISTLVDPFGEIIGNPGYQSTTKEGIVYGIDRRFQYESWYEAPANWTAAWRHSSSLRQSASVEYYYWSQQTGNVLIAKDNGANYTPRSLNELIPSFSISDASVKEGESKEIKIYRTNNNSSAATIYLRLRPGSAVPGDSLDYNNYINAQEEKLVFREGESEKYIRIFANNDNIVEGDEIFYIDIDQKSSTSNGWGIIATKESGRIDITDATSPGKLVDIKGETVIIRPFDSGPADLTSVNYREGVLSHNNGSLLVNHQSLNIASSWRTDQDESIAKMDNRIRFYIAGEWRDYGETRQIHPSVKTKQFQYSISEDKKLGVYIDRDGYANAISLVNGANINLGLYGCDPYIINNRSLLLERGSIPSVSEKSGNWGVIKYDLELSSRFLTAINIQPTYSLSVTQSVLGEGESFSSTVVTTNLAAGTKLYYALSGTGITESDFRNGDRLTGFGTINANGSFSFSHTLASDLTTEGTETLSIKLFSDAALTTQVGSAATVTIYDTSTTPASTININGNNNGIANTGTINNSGTINTGTINTNSGNTTNITNNNIDKSKTVTIAPTTINNITNNITNNISVNAVIANTSAPTYNVSNTYAKNLVGDVLTGSPQLNQNSYDAKFYNLGGGRYGVQQKGKSTIDEITGATSLQFQDQAISLASDVAATFNQVKGIDDVSGVVFRLYNAAFARLPDANGLENWINGNKSGGQTYASSALEFSKSQEFKNRYGSNVTDTQYVTTLYNNVLGRAPDAGGLAHYQGLLASGKDRGSLLLDFSESPENRGLFTKVTGLS